MKSTKQLTSKNGILIWCGQKITELQKNLGQTPIYIYDQLAITKRVQFLRSIFPKEVKIHYAIKANPMPEVVNHLASLVDGFDVASKGELQIALQSKFKREDISIAGPGKSIDELEFAVQSGVVINVESFREIEVLAQIQKRYSIQAKVAIRINPNFELKGSGMKMGGGPKQFGIDSELVPEAVGEIIKHVFNFFGFHIYSGSQNLNSNSIIEAQTKTLELAVSLSQSLKLNCRFVNIGGGFGIPYFVEEKPLPVQSVAENLFKLVEMAKIQLPKTELIVELGRYLVGEAGIYVCQIVDKKVSRGRTYLITNGGLHHHLAATGNLGQIIRRNYPMAIGNKMDEKVMEEVSIVGPLCTPLDTFADKIVLPKAAIGDYVVLFQSGAYGATASPQLFLSHPKVLELLV